MLECSNYCTYLIIAKCRAGEMLKETKRNKGAAGSISIVTGTKGVLVTVMDSTPDLVSTQLYNIQ